MITISGAPVSWLVDEWNGNGSYQTLTQFRTTTGQEQHGVQGNPNFEANSFILLSNSPAVDKAVLIANFNDAGSAWAFSGLAPDMGANEFGIKPPGAHRRRPLNHLTWATLVIHFPTQNRSMEFLCRLMEKNGLWEKLLDEEGRIEIYDRRGVVVRTFPDANSTTTWDGRNEKGDVVGAGVYIVRELSGRFEKSGGGEIDVCDLEFDF